MTIGYRRCCGIDVHKKSISACVLPPVGMKGGGMEQMNHLETKIKLNEEVEKRVSSESESIGRLCSIPGVHRISAWTILAETGTDRRCSRIPDD